MNKQGLQCYIHDESDALRFELAGSLSNGGAQRVYQAWQTALSILGDRTTIIDISFVTDADAYGSALLALWHRNGARIIAASPQSRALAEPIISEVLPALLPRKSWFQRLKIVFRRLQTDIAPLPCIASKASIGKVVGIRLAAMFAANDVVYLMRRVRIAFMKKAILTPKGGAFCDESPQRLTYVTGQAACVAVPAPWPRS